ncbi:NUDIX hydrolase [Diaminobutyricimonas aerilata]|uniref:NUDIX hydrolase n=1 Tax=Diaminobutyricimonas aerilata TaxID=1162967 RepID=UPI003CCC3B8F
MAAGLIVDDAGRMLLVRKRGTTVFMQPGGKLEPGEDGAQALARELNEELGLPVSTLGYEFLGRFDAAAANEAGHRVDADVFAVPTPRDIAVAAEIEEALWADVEEARALPLAPLTLDHLIPIVVTRLGG